MFQKGTMQYVNGIPVKPGSSWAVDGMKPPFEAAMLCEAIDPEPSCSVEVKLAGRSVMNRTGFRNLDEARSVALKVPYDALADLVADAIAARNED